MYGHDPARATAPPTILVVTGCTGGTPQGTVEGSGNINILLPLLYGPRRDKTCLRGVPTKVSSATETC